MLYLMIALFFSLFAVATQATASEATCVEEYYSGNFSATSNVDKNGIDETISKILNSIGLKSDITTVPCNWAQFSAVAWVAGAQQFTGVPEGRYIIYNSTQIQRVVGDDDALRVALLAHELGHFLNNDFSTGRAALGRSQRESDADYFAGCIVARFEFRSDDVLELIARIRNGTGGQGYPTRDESDELVLSGYNSCSRYVVHTMLDQEAAEVHAKEVVRLFGIGQHDVIYNTLLSDYSKQKYTSDGLRDIGVRFKENFNFDEILHVSTVGVNSLKDPDNYPPGDYMIVTMKVKTQGSDFLSNVLLGWQGKDWYVYNFNFTPI